MVIMFDIQKISHFCKKKHTYFNLKTGYFFIYLTDYIIFIIYNSTFDSSINSVVIHY